MKNYVLTVATLIATLGAAHADFPEPFNKTACLAAANNEPNAIARCDALDACFTINSANLGDLEGCNFKAEEAYKLAISGKPTVAPASVTTSPAASDYDMKTGKGFDEANQGRGQ